jgi:hypothetical protein
MDGLKLASVLLVIYLGLLTAIGAASVRVPRVRAWYLPHVRAFAVLVLLGCVALFVVIGVQATR